MTPRSLLPRPLVLASFAWLAAGPIAAQNLSPFLPPAAATNTAAPTAGAPLQYRGFTEDSGGVRFRIVDPARKTGTWLKLNERDTTFDVTVKQSGADYATVVVEHQGRTLTLALPESKVASSGSASQPAPAVAPPPPMMTNVPPAVTQAVVVNPTPADEQRRLQAVADEVSRRRALREQAQQQLIQGSPPGVQPGAPQNAPGQPRRP